MDTAKFTVKPSNEFLTQVSTEIASHKPERGGFVFGYLQNNQFIVESFLFDKDASVTGASYQPSKGAVLRINSYATKTGYQLLGILHSHPGNLDHPSSGDYGSFQAVLEVNQSVMDVLLCPIVTLNPKSISEHELELKPTKGRAKISFYVYDGSKVIPATLQKQLATEQKQLATEPVKSLTLGTIAGAHLSGDDKLFSRVESIIPTTKLGSTKILIFGTGSVGAAVAEGLARSGIQNFALVDISRVKVANIARTVFTHADLGKYKVLAVKERILAINPSASVTTLPKTDQENPKQILEDTRFFLSVISESDIIINGADSFDVQNLLCRIGYEFNKTMIFPGVYVGGFGGDIVVCDPGTQTPCVSCVTGREKEYAGKNFVDYQTGRIKSINALGTDIMAIVSALCRTVLGLIAYKNNLNDSKELYRLGLDILESGYFMRRMSLYVQEWIHAAQAIGRSASTVGEYAETSFWYNLKPGQYSDLDEKRRKCNVCGPNRISLDDHLNQMGVSASALRHTLNFSNQ